MSVKLPSAGQNTLQRLQSTKQRLERFVQRHGPTAAEGIRRDAKQFAKKLDALNKSRRYVLHPEKNRFLGWWDGLTTLALIYTAALTPFETSFIPPVIGPAAWKDGWFIANRSLDVIFGCDMILQFFVAFQTGNSFGGKTWVDDHGQVMRHYLRSWFALDSATVFVPGAFDLYQASETFAPLVTDDQDDAGGVGARMGMLRVLRVLRLVKLVRLLRASRIFERWRSRITLSSATRTWLSCVLLLVTSSHWFACVIALQASLHDNPHDTWMGDRAFGLCTTAFESETEESVMLLGESWLLVRRGHDDQLSGGSSAASLTSSTPEPAAAVLPGCGGVTLWSWYLAAFSWSTMVITGTGGTDFYPSGDSDAETLIVLVLVVLGAFLWTLVLAAFCDVATNSNPTVIAFRQHLDRLNMLISIHKLPKGMAQRMRSYMHQQVGVMVREDCKSTLTFLSQALQVEVVLHVHSHWLDYVYFVRPLDAPVKVRLAMAMKTQMLSPKEVAPTGYLYVITRGSVMLGARVLSRGMAWGDDILLYNSKHFLPFLACALTYTDVTKVNRDTLFDLAEAYPGSIQRLRRLGLLLALRRGIVRRAREIRQQNLSRSHSQNLGTFLNKVHDATSKTVCKAQEESQSIALMLTKEEVARKRRHRHTGEYDEAASGTCAIDLDKVLGAILEMRNSLHALTATVGELQQEVRETKVREPLVRGAWSPAPMVAVPPTSASTQAGNVVACSSPGDGDTPYEV